MSTLLAAPINQARFVKIIVVMGSVRRLFAWAQVALVQKLKTAALKIATYPLGCKIDSRNSSLSGSNRRVPEIIVVVTPLAVSNIASPFSVMPRKVP